MIGGIPMPSLTSLAMGAAFKALFKRVGKLIGAIRKRLGNAASHPPRPVDNAGAGLAGPAAAAAHERARNSLTTRRGAGP